MGQRAEKRKEKRNQRKIERRQVRQTAKTDRAALKYQAQTVQAENGIEPKSPLSDTITGVMAIAKKFVGSQNDPEINYQPDYEEKTMFSSIPKPLLYGLLFLFGLGGLWVLKSKNK